jgi:hypothetical protein
MKQSSDVSEPEIEEPELIINEKNEGQCVKNNDDNGIKKESVASEEKEEDSGESPELPSKVCNCTHVIRQAATHFND